MANNERNAVLTQLQNGGLIRWTDAHHAWIRPVDDGQKMARIKVSTAQALFEDGLIRETGEPHWFSLAETPKPAEACGSQRRSHAKLFGYSVNSILLWMGHQNFTAKQAEAALSANGITLAGSSVRGSLGAGRKDSPRFNPARLPQLPDEIAMHLREFASKQPA